MKIKKQIFFFLTFTATFFLSCNNVEDITEEQHSVVIDFKNEDLGLKLKSLNDVNNDHLEYKKKFGIALAKAMKQSKELRSFLKDEALKMFDKDYDVLYYRSKDSYITNNLTFRDLLLPYFENASDLDVLENEYPLLTILITNLPNDIFSAETWDVSTTVPLVAYQKNRQSEFTYIKNNGEEIELEEGILFEPFIILKTSDRVSVSNITPLTKNGDKLLYEIDFNLPFFDNLNKNIKTRTLISYPLYPELIPDFTDEWFDSKIIEAFDLYKNIDGWQRDYIYYDISPSKTRGAFNYNYIETIHTFRLNANNANETLEIMDYISDNTGRPSTLSSFVSEGVFEFVFKCFVNGVNGVGSQIDLYYQVNRNDLFNFVWQYLPSPSGGIAGVLSDVSTNTVLLNLPIICWDIKDYSTSIKIAIEEVDPSGSTVIRETHRSSVATNFETSFGMEKVGMKFGASSKKDIDSRHERVIHHNNDDLGEVVLNFADKFIIDYSEEDYGTRNIMTILFSNKYWHTREYNTGMCTIDFLPLKVQ